MAASIKDPETDRLARALSAATGETITDAIRNALRDRLARDATLRFGRSRHRAAMRFSDGYSYALSVESGESLRCVGNDFTRTDVSVSPW
jgi:hypothetical protein